MKCPRPIVELAKARRRAAPGDVLAIDADDLAFASDVVAWCEATGAELLDLIRGEDATHARIKLHSGGPSR
ncbi:MAG: sulfurtransferase TusA family protein [Planctomycetes bacterium]|nr:sulfurtransferase TusA family protein [Planctomycetota bacterium]